MKKLISQEKLDGWQLTHTTHSDTGIDIKNIVRFEQLNVMERENKSTST